ncbi:hypothetical protein CDCA_CDCA02G0565 [Cyanidium caldarium]|uniref:Membrane-associated protein n=1 Tax=Cyanidium caldarium TaxID=2771 RepID=A0AAV9IR30_CYACA|nr:hypothetical protein CDCA_CDCA02G0565 [Cyanidium caldarium]
MGLLPAAVDVRDTATPTAANAFLLWATLRSSCVVGFVVGLLLSTLCTPVVGMSNTLRMVLRAQVGSLAFAAASQAVGLLLVLLSAPDEASRATSALPSELSYWVAESAFGACSFSVGNILGALLGCVLGLLLSIQFGSLLACDIEEEWALVVRCAVESLQASGPFGKLGYLKRGSWLTEWLVKARPPACESDTCTAVDTTDTTSATEKDDSMAVAVAVDGDDDRRWSLCLSSPL